MGGFYSSLSRESSHSLEREVRGALTVQRGERAELVVDASVTLSLPLSRTDYVLSRERGRVRGAFPVQWRESIVRRVINRRSLSLYS